MESFDKADGVGKLGRPDRLAGLDKADRPDRFAGLSSDNNLCFCGRLGFLVPSGLSVCLMRLCSLVRLRLTATCRVP